MHVAQGKIEFHQVAREYQIKFFSLLFFSLYLWNSTSDTWQMLFQNEVVDNTYKIDELKKTVEAYENNITRLKEEVTKTTKLADSAHAREQNAQEMIENLRLNITKLSLEIEQKNKQLAAEKE